MRGGCASSEVSKGRSCMIRGVVAKRKGKEILVVIARRGMNKREFPEGDVTDEVEEC